MARVSLSLCLLFVARALAASIGEDGIFEESEFAKVIKGPVSGNRVGDESIVSCPKNYYLSECMCGPSKNCDGSWIRQINRGNVCVAYNKAQAHGVIAYGLCEQLIINMETEMTRVPKTECPPNYTLISCMMHSYYTDRWPNAEGLVDGDTCTTTPDCQLCRVQAHCLRTRKFTSHSLKKR